MILVGVTGGIGSGKSTAAGMLAALGAVVVDADELAREAVAVGTPGLAAVTRALGPKVLAADGSLDRTAVAKLVFADPASRAELNGIVHPEVARLMRERVTGLPEGAVVVYDVPLLAETGLDRECDYVVVVDVPEPVQVQRLMAARGMSRDDAVARIRSQASREDRLAVADFVVDNGTDDPDPDRPALAARVREIWDVIRQAAGTTGVSDRGRTVKE